MRLLTAGLSSCAQARAPGPPALAARQSHSLVNRGLGARLTRSAEPGARSPEPRAVHLTGKPLPVCGAGTSHWECVPGGQKALLVMETHQLAQPMKDFRSANVKT